MSPVLRPSHGEAPVRRLHRASDGRVIGGVCAGLGEHLGVERMVIRVAFLLLALAGGAGLVMYAAFWMFAPLEAGGRDEPARSAHLGYLVALAALAVGGIVASLSAGLEPTGPVFWPLVAAGFGVVVLWRQADEAARARWRAATHPRTPGMLARTLLGLALVAGGGLAFLAGGADLARAAGVVASTGVVVVGLALISLPWWLRMGRELSAERSARIREQERAEVAAHVHDSVLHTLTLIQRHVEDPRAVARLARAQERELRSWLYRQQPSQGAVPTTLAAALERAAAEVEDEHGVTVEVVTVGDAPVDEPAAALLLATREALVNAAKYAGGAPISVFAEADAHGGQVSVFVRDRGPGFDVAAVPPDRLGVRQSILGRMTRNGGGAVVRSAAGEGTEVALTMPARSRP